MSESKGAVAWLRRQTQYELARDRNRLGQWPNGAAGPEDANLADEAA